MAPSTVSQNSTQTSPPQESSIPAKRSLRSRSSNSTLTSNSHQDTTKIVSEDKDSGGVASKLNSEIVVVSGGGGGSDHDARGGKFPFQTYYPSLFAFAGKIKVTAPDDLPLNDLSPTLARD